MEGTRGVGGVPEAVLVSSGATLGIPEQSVLLPAPSSLITLEQLPIKLQQKEKRQPQMLNYAKTFSRLFVSFHLCCT